MKVFQFSEQSEGVSLSATIDDVGGKGLSLLRMSRLGVPVPPGFIVPVTVCRTYLQDGALPPEFDTVIRNGLKHIEQKTSMMNTIVFVIRFSWLALVFLTNGTKTQTKIKMMARGVTFVNGTEMPSSSVRKK